MRNLSLIIGIILAIVFMVIGFITYKDFFTWSLPKIPGVVYVTTALTEQFTKAFLFSLTLAGIPLSVVLIWKLAPVLSASRKFLSILIIIIWVVCGMFLREFMIQSKAKQLGTLQDEMSSDPTEKIQITIPLKEVNIEVYMFGGLVIGSAISYFALRQNKKETLGLSF